MISAVPTYSPFDRAETGSIAAAAQWLSGLVTGSLAAALCVIAIAFLGFLMFSGRVPFRAGFKTVLGCFILLGAPIVASALMQLGELGPYDEGPLPTTTASQTRAPLPQSSYDPYAGASLRQD